MVIAHSQLVLQRHSRGLPQPNRSLKGVVTLTRQPQAIAMRAILTSPRSPPATCSVPRAKTAEVSDVILDDAGR